MNRFAFSIGLACAVMGTAIVATPSLAATVQFTTVGADQYTVPADVYFLEVTATGGGGGGGNVSGGNGCIVTATVPVTPFEVIDLAVGGGGGAGSNFGGGGGGSSYFNISDETYRVVAGGGGGGGFNSGNGGNACEAGTGAGSDGVGGAVGGGAPGNASGVGGIGGSGSPGIGGDGGAGLNGSGAAGVTGGGAGGGASGTGTGGLAASNDSGGAGGNGGGAGGVGGPGGKGGGGAGWGGGGGGGQSGSGGAGGSIGPDATYTMGTNAGGASAAGDAGSISVTTVSSYSLLYNANGATSGSVPGDNGHYLTGESTTVAGNSGDLNKKNSTFTGWNTVADGSGVGYAPGSSLTFGASNVTLYATFAEKGKQKLTPGTVPRAIKNPGTTRLNRANALTANGVPLTAKARAKLTRGDRSCHRLIKKAPRGLAIRSSGMCTFTLTVTYTAPETATLQSFKKVKVFRVAL